MSWELFKRISILSPLVLFLGFGTRAVGQTSRLKTDSPVNVLVSYYEAINNKDYRRAYSYFETPTKSYASFVRGYANTEHVEVILQPPVDIEGAAGSLYADAPTVLLVTERGGKSQLFAGCYTLRKSNLRPPDIPREPAWHIYRASLRPVSSNDEIPTLLSKACSSQSGNSPEVSSLEPARVPGIIDYGDGRTEDVISVPSSVRANQEFQVTVNTFGGGCEESGDTEVAVTKRRATLTVYDLTTATRPGVVCTMILKRIPHTATLRFANIGQARIRVWGRRVRSGPSSVGEPVVIEHRVLVNLR